MEGQDSCSTLSPYGGSYGSHPDDSFRFVLPQLGISTTTVRTVHFRIFRETNRTIKKKVIGQISAEQRLSPKKTIGRYGEFIARVADPLSSEFGFTLSRTRGFQGFCMCEVCSSDMTTTMSNTAARDSARKRVTGMVLFEIRL
jgi:hypothetical protein